MRRFSFFFLIATFTACASTQPREGIKGQVFWISGNQMPGPEVNKSAHYGVQREVFVYEATTLKDVTVLDNGLYADVKTNLVTTITTKADGSFRLKLEPGKYSLFVKEPGGLFANRFDQHSTINPVTVKEKEYTWLPISIDYQAAY